MSEADQAAKADLSKLLWESPEGEYPSRRMFLTPNNGLGISVSGYTVVMPIQDWHKLACAGAPPLRFPPAPCQ